MPNPCTFSINGVVFGISSLDIVVQLSSNELHRCGTLVFVQHETSMLTLTCGSWTKSSAQSRDQNRLLRLCEQVIDQRR